MRREGFASSRLTSLRRSNHPAHHVGRFCYDGQQSGGSEPFAARQGLLGQLGETERPLFRCCSSGGAAPLVTAVVASSPSRVTTVVTSGSSILTTVHPDGLRLGV